MNNSENIKTNEDNIRNGFFELDWNNEFIEKLLDAGYKGETNEQIVDGWFKTIASNILKEEGLDPEMLASLALNTPNSVILFQRFCHLAKDKKGYQFS